MISMRFAVAGAVSDAAASNRSKSLVTPDLLEEATLPEVVENRPQGYEHHPDNDREAVALAERLGEVHAEERGDEGEWQQHRAERGEDAEDLVAAVGDDRLVGVLQRLDDLLEVLEHV